MIERMLQLAIKISILRCHIEQSVARKAKHSARVSAFLVLFRLRLLLLLSVVRAGGHLTTFVRPPDTPVCLGISLPVSN